MPIQFACSSCQKKLQVPDDAAGKKGRCNQCGHLNTIPSASDAESAASFVTKAAETEVAAPQAPVQQAFTSATYSVRSSVNGAVFGPADRPTLDQWLSEGRITPDCQLLETGTQTWIAAKSFFPSLGGGGADPLSPFQNTGTSPTSGGEVNPYASAPRAASTLSPKVLAEIVPTWGDLGFCISHGFAMWQKNFGLLLGVFATILGLNYLFQILLQVTVGGLANVGPEVAFTVGGVVWLIGYVFQTWLGAGGIKIACDLARGQRAEYSDLFGQGNKILRLIAFNLLYLIPFAALAGILFLAIGGDVRGNEAIFAVGALVLVLLAVVVALLAWPAMYLIVDRNMKLGEAIPKSIAIGSKNAILAIPLFIVAGLASASGIIACFIGVIATMSIGQMMIAAGYLNMSGQLKAPR